MRALAPILCAATAALAAPPALATPPEPPWSSNGNPVVTAAGDQAWIAAAPFEVGGVLVAWSDGRFGGLPEADIYAQALTETGRVAPGWPVNGIPVCTESGWQRDVSVVTDAGGAYIAWTDGRAITDAVYLQRVTNDGAVAPGWPSGGLRVGPDPLGQRPSLATDGADGVFIARIEGNPQTFRILRITEAGSPAPGWPADGVSLGAAHTAFHALMADGEGGVFAAWVAPGGQGNGRVRVQHLIAEGAVHPAWPTEGVAIGNELASAYQVGPLLSDQAGGVYVPWQDVAGVCPVGFGACGDQNLLRLDAIGPSPGWLLVGRRIGPPGTITSDGLGGTLYVWVEGGFFFLAPPAVIFARVTRLDDMGERMPGWQRLGNPVCTEEGYQNVPSAIADGMGGAFVGWLDFRTSESVLYVSRLDAAGTIAPLWPVTGSIAAPAAVEPHELVLVDAGVGRAIAVWSDRRYGSLDIFAEVVVPGPAGPPRPLAEVFDGSAQFGITQMRPNPTSGTFWAIIGLPAAGRASLELFDIVGRVVEETAVETAGPARGAVRFNAAHRMAPGVYWLRLRQGPRSAMARVVVSD